MPSSRAMSSMVGIGGSSKLEVPKCQEQPEEDPNFKL
jgi:hypothetical protein